jgi:segregation and condensation protein B
MLFVGHPTNEPLIGENVASLMRGVTTIEIDELTQELNESYLAEGAPYTVESSGAGYRLVLRPEHGAVRDKFYGRVKEAKLSRANIDVLAIVAYNQPLSRPEVDKLRGRPSGTVLSQLVRRELLRIDRPIDNQRTVIYTTTDRFLDLFGLDSLDDLPRTSDADRTL